MNTQSALEELPGELMMWVLIVSELLVFGAGLVAFLTMRLTDVQGFASAQAGLNQTLAGMNTIILVTSGYLAARGVRAVALEQLRHARWHFLWAGLLGAGFLAIKFKEYAGEFAQGIGPDTHSFYMFYFLLTGFHAAHVLAGVLLLAGLAFRPTPEPTENAVAFWHMVDLVWVILFPVIYLVH